MTPLAEEQQRLSHLKNDLSGKRTQLLKELEEVSLGCVCELYKKLGATFASLAATTSS
jgi:hypothetical protein